MSDYNRRYNLTLESFLEYKKIYERLDMSDREIASKINEADIILSELKDNIQLPTGEVQENIDVRLRRAEILVTKIYQALSNWAPVPPPPISPDEIEDENDENDEKKNRNNN